ncbi:hypothetical protein, partial [Streptococcus pneumoniae]
LSKIGLTTTLKNAWTTSRQVNFFWVANFNLKFGEKVGKQFHPKKTKKPNKSLAIAGDLCYSIMVL